MSQFGSHNFDEEYHDDYEMDQSAAVKAESGRMDTTGGYICKIVKAEATVSEGKGTRGIVFGVVSSSGEDAEFTLWTKKADGTTIFGFNQLQSIMVLTGVKSMRGIKGTVTRWDQVAGQRIDMPGTVYPELIGKKVGLMMQKELYTKNSGGEGFRMNMVGAYHPETMHTCTELKSGVARAEKAMKMIEKLKDKDSRTTVASTTVSSGPMVDDGF